MGDVVRNHSKGRGLLKLHVARVIVFRLWVFLQTDELMNWLDRLMETGSEGAVISRHLHKSMSPSLEAEHLRIAMDLDLLEY